MVTVEDVKNNISHENHEILLTLVEEAKAAKNKRTELPPEHADLRGLLSNLMTKIELDTRLAEQQRVQSKMLSVKDISIPAVLVVGMLVGAFQISGWIKEYQASITQLATELRTEIREFRREIDFRTTDKFPRSDFVNICFNWQVNNPSIKLDCHLISMYEAKTPLPSIRTQPKDK